ncbi:S8 family serine peptidase [Streptomyces sp. NPDC057301]|uniref:cyanobactin maturation protease PatG family protein n=1 Tax=Streptomyces sp. NPDC057301 TaxID=3346093 RepID=UPI00362959C7
MDVRSVLQGLPEPEQMLGDPEVCIAVLDGPVDLSHRCFAGADLTRLDTLVQDPASQGLMSLHGTHVTSLLFGQPGREHAGGPGPVVGLAPRCRGLILPVFRDTPEGRVPQLDLARAIERAVQEGAHVINISGGERTPGGEADSMLARALRLCEDSGVVVVAAVGNDGCDCLQVPAAVPSVLAVGATGVDGRPLETNNWGVAYRTNGVLAPGQDIQGAAPGGGLQALTGSSFAAPAVSGVTALLVATQLHEGHKADPTAAAQAILDAATVIPCSPSDAPECRRHLVGDLNAKRAYDLVSNQGSTPVSPDVARVPSPPSASHGARAAATTSEPGVSAAGEPSPLGNSHSEPNQGASAMSTQPNTAHEQAETTVEATGNGDTGSLAAPLAPPSPQQVEAANSASEGRAASEPSPLETAHSEPSEGANPMAAQPTRAREEAHITGEGATAMPPAGLAADGSGHEGGVRPSSECGCGGSPESGCECGGNGGSRQLIYAVGTIGVDFLTEARRDMFRQRMNAVTLPATEDQPERELPPNPYDGQQLHDFLAEEPWLSDQVQWLLRIDDYTPIYALKAQQPVAMDWSRPLVPPNPDKAGASDLSLEQKLDYLTETLSHPPVSTIYRIFREAVKGQQISPLHPGHISRVSIPGELTGRTVTLFSGDQVPEVEVKTPGVHTWNEGALVKAVVQAIRAREEEPVTTERPRVQIPMSDPELERLVHAFLTKVYDEFRNLGQTPADRALNAAGTNAFNFADSIKDGLLSGGMVPQADGEGLKHLYALDSITVSKSPYCRRSSLCEDVTITYFDPENERRALTRYRYTYDVSYHMPVSLAPVRVFLDR